MIMERVPDTNRQAYERHGAALIRFATSLVGPSDAADVVQTAMASLIGTGALAEADNQRALMYRAVLNQARSLQRSAMRRRRREQRFADQIVASDPAIRPEVAAAVAGLSAQQRACVFLTYWEDLSPVQVAEHLDIAEGTVKAHLARARSRLREVLDE
jgi:RNA polymerase sigma-70 factor (ECF subfamily)